MLGPFAGQFGAAVFADFHRIASQARDVNATLRVPEVVVVGTVGTGKSAFIDAFLDLPYTVGRKERGTLRPIFINLVNNAECPEPRLTVRRDAVSGATRDTLVDVAKLAEVVAERNVESDVPLYITCEWKQCLNLLIIDTPGLPEAPAAPVPGTGAGDESVDVADPEERVAALALLSTLTAPAERIIVYVEDTIIEGAPGVPEFLRKADPLMERTLFVRTKLDKALEAVAQAGGSVALNQHLGEAPRVQTTFWCSFPWGRSRTKYATRELLAEKVVQMSDADVRTLEELQFDRRFVNQFGVRAVRAFLVQLVWRRYQDTIPEVAKALADERKRVSAELTRVSNLITSLDTYKLRAAASSYVLAFLQALEKLLAGTLAGNPGQNGQTLAQEHHEEEAGPWLDANHQVLSFDPDELGVPNPDAKLYGGQQFARLLAEFKAVASSITLGEVSVSEVATAAGPTRINNVSNVAWAASDLAQKRVQRALMPLVEHLYRRAAYILRRLADVAERVVAREAREARVEAANSSFSFGGTTSAASIGSVLQAQMINVEEYPFFVQSIKALYVEFVSAAASVTQSKCLDEFYSTRIIFWASGAHKLPDLKAASEDDAVRAVTALSEKLFVEQRDRIVENVLLKCHNFFLVPMQTDLWGDIQGKVTQFDDLMISELFQTASMRESFKRDQAKLRAVFQELQDKETSLTAAVNNFSHPQ